MKRKWGTFRSITPDVLQIIINDAVSVAQVLRHFEMVNTTGNQRTFWKTVKILGLNAAHFHRGKGSPLPKSIEHKNKLSLSKLEKYGITIEECEHNHKCGNRWCNVHKAFVPENSFSSKKRGTCRQCSRERNFEIMHGLPYDWYHSTLEKQHGTCGICNTTPENEKVLCLDHNHACCAGEQSCGKCARGLLCNKCNTLVGWLEKNKDILEIALKWCGSPVWN